MYESLLLKLHSGCGGGNSSICYLRDTYIYICYIHIHICIISQCFPPFSGDIAPRSYERESKY